VAACLFPDSSLSLNPAVPSPCGSSFSRDEIEGEDVIRHHFRRQFVCRSGSVFAWHWNRFWLADGFTLLKSGFFQPSRTPFILALWPAST